MKKKYILFALFLIGCVSKEPQLNTYNNTEIRIIFANDVKKECVKDNKSNIFCECSAVQLCSNLSVEKQVEYINARKYGNQDMVSKAMLNTESLTKNISKFCSDKIRNGESFYIHTKFN